jgi:hypothetical protein
VLFGPSTDLKAAGEYVDSSTPGPPRPVSTVGNFDAASPADALVPSSLDEVSSGTIVGLLSVVGVPGSVFFSFSRCSNPSTRFRRASSTSVFGPLFFGTASANGTTNTD